MPPSLSEYVAASKLVHNQREGSPITRQRAVGHASTEELGGTYLFSKAEGDERCHGRAVSSVLAQVRSRGS